MAKPPFSQLGPITPCLWFDSHAVEAARLYVSIFPNSRLLDESHYSDAGQEIHQKPAGSVMSVDFVLNGQPFVALNGGPMYRFSEAVSFQVACETQEEVDYYWEKLGEGGDPKSRQCGWLKDRFGVSWQVFPKLLITWMTDPDPVKAKRVTTAMLSMEKIDLEGLRRAYEG